MTNDSPFQVVAERIAGSRTTRFVLSHSGRPLCWREVLESWSHDVAFRRQFTRLLADSPLAGFRWETPPITRGRLECPFEFVLLDAHGFASRDSDPSAFSEKFRTLKDERGILTFPNLGGDATLIVPLPETEPQIYGHLASFLRHASSDQVDALWQVVGSTVLGAVTANPIWLSSAGGGVPWLHIRIDSRPKYYRYAPYRESPPAT